MQKTEAVEVVSRSARRIASAPFWCHAVALGLLLLALLPYVGWDVSYSADEGAAIIQAQHLSAGDGWIVDHPLPEVDPEGEWFPLELSFRGPDGVGPFVKHPLYAVMLAGADRLGGPLIMMLLSLAGTWLAAWGAAALAIELLGGYRRTALWLAGAGSPLLFNGYWVIAHTLAAAACVWSVVLLVRASRGRVPPAQLLLVPLLAFAAGLLRTESALFALALGGCAGLAALVGRRVELFVLAGCVALTAPASRWLDATASRRILGGPISSEPPFFPRSRGGGFADRWDGFTNTWIRPGTADGSSVTAALTVVGVLLVVALLAHRHVDRRAAVVGAYVGAGIVVVRALVASPATIPGLLVAFPVLMAAIVWGPPLVRNGSREVRLVCGVVLITWGLVLAKQYSEGAGAEWGGRYFAITLPLVVPLVIGAVRVGIRELTAREVRIGLAPVVVVTVALSIASVREMRQGHHYARDALSTIEEVADRVGADPVIVTNLPLLPRGDWRLFHEHRWLLADPAKAPELPRKLASAGIERWVLVVRDLEESLDHFDVEVVEEAVPGIIAIVETRD